MSDRSRRNALSNDEAMADAESMCLPCKLCGGKAKISDAGPGWGYYIRCENAKECLVGETRRSGWAYNVMELWNKAMAPAAEITRLQKERDTAREALRELNCPRPCSGRPDDFTVGQCFDAGECGCLVPGALKDKEVAG